MLETIVIPHLDGLYFCESLFAMMSPADPFFIVWQMCCDAGRRYPSFMVLRSQIQRGVVDAATYPVRMRNDEEESASDRFFSEIRGRRK